MVSLQCREECVACRYAANVPVGYYTQVLGLGTKPSDVVFTSDKGNMNPVLL